MPEQPFSTVFIDCDSTLSQIEGVDELARRRGVGTEVAALTEAAMQGRVPLESVYARRLELIRPDRALVDWLGRRYLETMVAGAAELVDALHALGKEVHLVSGGLLQAIEPLADVLQLRAGRLHAVAVRFDAAGAYQGFDSDSPLCRAGGKAAVVRRVAAGRRAAAIGDGVTDLEMQEAGAMLIGFGGVAEREAVRARADAWLAAAPLTAALPYLLTAAEQQRRD